MSQEITDTSKKDFTKSWVNSSRFLFYLEVFCMIALFVGMSYNLYLHRYKGKPEVEIQNSSKYTPEYK
ncbi:hypothetical protein ACI6Q2_13445 [Chitinophagaceae bacterium LWZ2-11]